MNAIDVRDLHFAYPDGTKALDGMSFTVPRGAKLAILGPNGAGKSTLLLHLNGIHVPQAGRVEIGGRPILPNDYRWARGPVGLVFQDPDDQVFAPTVWEDVAFGPRNQGLPEDEIEERAREALFAVGLLDLAGRPPHHLSYGQRKRVAIAGVLAMRPEVVVLDEPTAYLDPRSVADLFLVLNRLAGAGTTLVIATHDVDLAAEWADRILVVKAGRALAHGPVELLADEALIADASLRPPVLVQLLQGILPGPVPLSIHEARAALLRLIPPGSPSPRPQ